MVLDSSAVIAILLREPGWQEVLERIEAAPAVAIGAPTLVETGLVLSSRLRRNALPEINEFLRELDAEVIPFHREHAETAVAAFLRYGKGRHPAALNFGDCLAYAVARVAGTPLAYVGEDFAQTDLGRSGEGGADSLA